jgi:hypothetical protein
VSADTIVPDLYRPQSLNRYGFVEGDPINNDDKTGNMKMQVEQRKEQQAESRLTWMTLRGYDSACGPAFAQLSCVRAAPGRFLEEQSGRLRWEYKDGFVVEQDATRRSFTGGLEADGSWAGEQGVELTVGGKLRVSVEDGNPGAARGSGAAKAKLVALAVMDTASDVPVRLFENTDTPLSGNGSVRGRIRTASNARRDAIRNKDYELARYYEAEMGTILSESIREGNRVTTTTLAGVTAAMLGPIAAGELYAAMAGPTTTIWTIGALRDTRLAGQLFGYARLNLPRLLWSPRVNDLWMKWAIRRGAIFYVASEISKRTLDASSNAWRITVFARELAMLEAAGYTKYGNWLVP